MRRGILTLSVGLTASVILAFSIPLAFLIFRSVESSALDEARFQTEAVAGYISASSPSKDDVSGFLTRGDQHRDGVTWVVAPTAPSWAAPKKAYPTRSSVNLISTPMATAGSATSRCRASTRSAADQ